MKKTKIICTIGPASSSKKTISSMTDAGCDVIRLNFSHGTHEDYAEKIKMIKEVRDEKRVPLPILLDTKGPEFRIKTFENDKILLKEAISKLLDRERKILLLRYFRGKTQSEVALIMGVSQVQISRLETKIITKLKHKLI